MKYSAVAVLAAAATASAWANDTIVWTTEVVDTYTTVCPGNAAVTVGGSTYTNTKTVASTIVVTDCPCTVSKPVYSTSSVYCNTCAVPTSAPAGPVYPISNSTVTSVPEVPTSAPGGSVGTTSAPVGTATPSTVPASGANSLVAMSGASLAGLLGLAAYIL